MDGDRWVFTFGFGHVHPITGASLARHYVVIPGRFDEAREKMVERFGTKWAFQYASEEQAGKDKYGLIELPLEGLAVPCP